MNEAKHDDDGKIGLQWILSMGGLDEVAKVGAYGAKKYGQSNWRGGSAWMRYCGSAVRHLACFIRGELLDNESGLPHLAHCAYNCLILLTWIKEGDGNDDRPKQMVEASIQVVPMGARVFAHCVDYSCSCDITCCVLHCRGTE